MNRRERCLTNRGQGGLGYSSGLVCRPAVTRDPRPLCQSLTVTDDRLAEDDAKKKAAPKEKASVLTSHTQSLSLSLDLFLTLSDDR